MWRFYDISNYIQSSLFSKEVFSRNRGSPTFFLYGTNGRVSITRNNNKTSCRIIASFWSREVVMITVAGAKIVSIALIY